MRYNGILFLFFLAVSTISLAQRNSKDFNLWTGASVQKKIVKKVKAELELQNRLKENATQNASNLVQIGLTHKLKKGFSITTDYRFTNKTSTTANRFDLKVAWKEKIIKRTWFKSAVKFQTDKDGNSNYWDNLLRFKWQVEHKIKKQKLFPYLSNEWFYELSDAGNQFEGFRVSTGIGFEPKKKHSFNLGYTIDKEINSTNPDTRFILALSYKLDL